MNASRFRSRCVAPLALLFVLGAATIATPPTLASADAQAGKAAGLPARLTDAEFWKLATEVSEPGGFFRITDNYTSNEREVGQMFDRAREERSMQFVRASASRAPGRCLGLTKLISSRHRKLTS